MYILGSMEEDQHSHLHQKDLKLLHLLLSKQAYQVKQPFCFFRQKLVLSHCNMNQMSLFIKINRNFIRFMKCCQHFQGNPFHRFFGDDILKWPRAVVSATKQHKETGRHKEIQG